MEFKHLGITLSVGEAEIRRIILERLGGGDLIFGEPAIGMTRPRIGASWEEEGGIYAGIVRGRDEGPDTCLIIGPGYDADLTWDEAQAYAKDLKAHGFSDWRLMYRPEGAVAYANVPELFDGKTHWTCEQHAEYPTHAGTQYFDNGGQGYWRKNDKLRARAVRSIAI